MHCRFVALLALVSLLTVSATAASQDLIRVDVTSVIADFARKPIGINVNLLLDDDDNRDSALDDLTAP
jgi:hypothetical protein